MRFWLFLFLLFTGCTQSDSGSSGAAALDGLQAADLAGVGFSVTQPERAVKDSKITVYGATALGAEIQVTRIENMGPEAAEQMLEQKKFQVEGLYQEEKSPYPGFLSKTVKCPKEFQPEIDLHKDSYLRVRAAANARKSLGVCNSAEMQYAAVILYYYCPRAKVFFQIESDLPKTETDKAREFLKKVSC